MLNHKEKFLSILFKWILIRIPADLPKRELVRVLAINSVGIICFTLCSIFGIIFYMQGYPTTSFVVVSAAAVIVIPTILNYLHHFDLARYIYTFFSPGLALFYSILVGPELGIGYFFIILFALPFIFLRYEERTLVVLYFFYNSLCLAYNEFGSPAWGSVMQLSTELMLIMRITVLMVLIVLAMIMFIAFYQLTVKNEKKLILSNQEIKKAYEVKQQFLATMSHELRTPLNGVITISKLLSENPGSEDSQTYLKHLRYSSQILLSIINDILDFSKLEANKMEVDFQPRDMREVLERIVSIYTPTALEKGLPLQLHISPKVCQTYLIDEVKLGQILGNLISNAIKYSEDGEVVVKVDCLSSDGSAHQLHFEVIDHGEGIPNEYLGWIFESFTQTNSIMTRKTGGTGLGLAIVKSLLQLHGSDIQVQSEVGKGSKFYFTLNYEITNQAEILTTNAFEISQHREILLVEDNPINLMVAKKLFSKWGLQVHTAQNGQEAIEICKTERFDLIFMDLHMPVLDGFLATESIRTISNLNMSTPIYALSADVIGEKNGAYQHYFSGFLSKPIEEKKVQAVLVKELMRPET